MAHVSASYRNGTPASVAGFVRVTRANGWLKSMWARFPSSHTPYAAIDGELLTVHDAPKGPPRKAYSLVGAVLDYDPSSRRNLDFTIALGRRQLLVICETPEARRKWIKAVQRAAKRSFAKFYILGAMVRKNAFGATYVCYDAKHTKLIFEVDIVETHDDNAQLTSAIQAERRACNMLKSDYIYTAVDIFRSAYEAHFVRQNLGEGGNVMDYIRVASTVSPSDAEVHAFGVALQTLYALKHMHSKYLAHRNICPGTIYLKNRRILLGGLNSSDVYPVEAVNDNVFDSREAFAKIPYAAPEITTGGKYGPKADLWALGSVIYEVVCGCPPPRIGEGAIFSELVWQDIQPQCRSLIKQLLCPFIRMRPTAAAALEHDWFIDGLALVPELRFKGTSNNHVEHDPTVQVILKYGAAEVRRRDPINFTKVYYNFEVRDYLNTVQPLRRMLVVYSRSFRFVYRLMHYANIKLESG